MSTAEKVNGVEPITKVSSLARDSNGVYVPAKALELIPEVAPILDLFLSGQMKEADEKVKNGDPKAETLYYALGQSSASLSSKVVSLTLRYRPKSDRGFQSLHVIRERREYFVLPYQSLTRAYSLMVRVM